MNDVLSGMNFLTTMTCGEQTDEANSHHQIGFRLGDGGEAFDDIVASGHGPVQSDLARVGK